MTLLPAIPLGQFVLDVGDPTGPFMVFFLLMATGVGIPLGEEFVIIPAGILIGSGNMPLLPSAIAAYLGVLASDFMWYAWCSWFGTPLLHKRWFKRLVHPRRILELKHRLEERGAWVIVMSRFIPGSRTPAVTTAGLLHMPFWKFALAESITVLFTVPLQLGLGIAVARGLGTESTAHLIKTMIGMVVLIVAILLCLAWWRAARRQAARPRARAAWLRRFRPSFARRRRHDDDGSSMKAI